MDEDKAVGRLARQAKRFAKEHGGATAAVEYLGARGTRIVLVGDDGFWGDLVAPSHGVAERAVESAGLVLKEDFGGDVRTGPYEWERMAGIQLGGGAGRR
jgi:hypothetical protein